LTTFEFDDIKFLSTFQIKTTFVFNDYVFVDIVFVDIDFDDIVFDDFNELKEFFSLKKSISVFRITSDHASFYD